MRRKEEGGGHHIQLHVQRPLDRQGDLFRQHNTHSHDWTGLDILHSPSTVHEQGFGSQELLLGSTGHHGLVRGHGNIFDHSNTHQSPKDPVVLRRRGQNVQERFICM